MGKSITFAMLQREKRKQWNKWLKSEQGQLAIQKTREAIQKKKEAKKHAPQVNSNDKQ